MRYIYKMSKKEAETFCPKSQTDWREWLVENHEAKQSVWLIFFRTSTGIPSLTWSEAVDEALCFGWIDSTKKSIDNKRYKQYFCKRKPKSTWSKVNKDKVKYLIDNDLMTEAGLKCIEVAKKNGSWTILDAVENLVVPDDLAKALEENKLTEQFQGLSKWAKKQILHRLLFAKRAATREKRMLEFLEELAKK